MTPEQEALLREADQWSRWGIGCTEPNAKLLCDLVYRLGCELRAALAHAERDTISYRDCCLDLIHAGIDSFGTLREGIGKLIAQRDAARAAEKPKG